MWVPRNTSKSETDYLNIQKKCKNTEQRGIFRPKRVKITGGWRKLHNKELCDLYSLPNTVRLVRHVEDRRKEKNAEKAIL
jgi:hypothetical protein